MRQINLIIAGILVFAPMAANADVIYESLPTSNSSHVSRHGTLGPVLADDFFSTAGGSVIGIEWWGAAPFSGNDLWEVTFHSDASGVPFATPGSGGISQHLLNAMGTDLGGGIFHYVAAWTPADIFIMASTTYWFSVANASGSTWTWANGAFPTMGSEAWDAVVSIGVGPNGGPHFGPWNGVSETDFAFRIIAAVPEPGTLALLGIGLLGMGLTRRRKKV